MHLSQFRIFGRKLTFLRGDGLNISCSKENTYEVKDEKISAHSMVSPNRYTTNKSAVAGISAINAYEY